MAGAAATSIMFPGGSAAAVAESLAWVDRLRAPKRRGSELLAEKLSQALTTEQP